MTHGNWTRPLSLFCLFLVGVALATSVHAAEPEKYRDDAQAIEGLINEQYAYLGRFPNSRVPLSTKLRQEAAQVDDRRSLLRYAERALLTLADHHAITGSSLPDSWAVVPSFADIWISKRGRDFVIDAVRDGSPAQHAGIERGDHLIAVTDVPTAQAVEAFWADLGLVPDDERASFAARVLAAGRRDRPRILTVQRGSSRPQRLELPNLYSARMNGAGIEFQRTADGLLITVNDSLGRSETIAAFDSAMEQAQPDQRVIIDLRNTPGGGNTTVARAILGWFVSEPRSYQVHELPVEQRRTGVARRWIEQVLPRPDKHHAGPVVVRVGRWTGSMGEGLAIGFHTIGALVVGEPMAGLRGAIYDHELENSGLVLKLPTERLLAVDGTPRERFVPVPPSS
jgi:carboxyl-terminal processing protease